jgi:hypothetical protein
MHLLSISDLSDLLLQSKFRNNNHYPKASFLTFLNLPYTSLSFSHSFPFTFIPLCLQGQNINLVFTATDIQWVFDLLPLI